MSKPVNVKSELIRIKKSFPNPLMSEVNSLFSKIKIYTKHNTNYGYDLILENEIIEIPVRIYWEEHRLLGPMSLSLKQREILACILTRHHNGYVREKYLKQIVSSNQSWATPYIVQLMGEYVVELLDFIWDNFEVINLKNLIEFIDNNKVFWDKTKQRIYSYWDCYQRYKCLSKMEYVGFLLIEKVENSIKQI